MPKRSSGKFRPMFIVSLNQIKEDIDYELQGVVLGIRSFSGSNPKFILDDGTGTILITISTQILHGRSLSLGDHVKVCGKRNIRHSQIKAYELIFLSDVRSEIVWLLEVVNNVGNFVGLAPWNGLENVDVAQSLKTQTVVCLSFDTSIQSVTL